MRANRHWCALGLWLCACSDAYSLPPTPCDDHCRAVQRAGCDEDWPADCVRDCESADGPRARGRCAAAWSARDACLLRADPHDFVCKDDKSRVPDNCLAERRRLSDCLAPGSGFCFDECVRQAAACHGELPDCEASCSHQTAACQAPSAAFNQCLLGYPVECREPFAPETRPLDQIPCLAEVGALLHCGE